MQIVRTYSVSRKDGDRLSVAAFALTRQAKDVYNSAIYQVRQVLSAFGNGAPGLVISNQRFERRLKVLDERLDAALSAATPDALKALRSRRDTQRLDHAEMVQLRQLEAAVEREPNVQRLRQARKHFIKNFMHQASTGVVQALQRQGVEVLVLGQNKGWKNASELHLQDFVRLERTPAHARLGGACVIHHWLRRAGRHPLWRGTWRYPHPASQRTSSPARVQEPRGLWPLGEPPFGPQRRLQHPAKGVPAL